MNKVDLPAPLGPSRPNIVDYWTPKDIPDNPVNILGYYLIKFLIIILSLILVWLLLLILSVSSYTLMSWYIWWWISLDSWLFLMFLLKYSKMQISKIKIEIYIKKYRNILN